MTDTGVEVTSFYRFQAVSTEALPLLQRELESLAAKENVLGLCLIGPEGINATLSGPRNGIRCFKELVRSRFGVESFKDSRAPKHPFNQFRVKIKDEIVTMGQPGLVPARKNEGHLTPAEWQAALNQPDTVVLDTRNRFEVEIGKFKGAIDLATEEFQEFPEKLKSADIPKDRNVLMYCTGGIRCEKAILEMRRQGYQNVFQLQGGILDYLKEFPDKDFEGECFVFDYRVAVDQQLNPSERYRFCPHCGQPGEEVITCVKCGRDEVICASCRGLGGKNLTCSKNCAHHFEIGSASRRPHRQELAKRRRT